MLFAVFVLLPLTKCQKYDKLFGSLKSVRGPEPGRNLGNFVRSRGNSSLWDQNEKEKRKMGKESNKKEKIVDRNERKEGSDSVLYFLLFLITRCMRLYEAVRATGNDILASFTAFACNQRQGKTVEMYGAFSSRGALCARGDDDAFSELVKREAPDLVHEVGSIANRAVDKIAHAMFGGMKQRRNSFVFASATFEGGGVFCQDGGGVFYQDGGGVFCQDGGGVFCQDGGGVF